MPKRQFSTPWFPYSGFATVVDLTRVKEEVSVGKSLAFDRRDQKRARKAPAKKK